MEPYTTRVRALTKLASGSYAEEEYESGELTYLSSLAVYFCGSSCMVSFPSRDGMEDLYHRMRTTRPINETVCYLDYMITNIVLWNAMYL